jgi:hypothetical protein
VVKRRLVRTRLPTETLAFNDHRASAAMTRSNCLIFALTKWVKHGGYLVVRKSRWGPFPHFLWSPDLQRFESYVPIDPRKRLIPPLLFRGRIREGD